MPTVKNLIYQFTSPESVLSHTYDLLQQLDPAFPKQLQSYHAALQLAKTGLAELSSPSIEEYIQSFETEISAELVYICWLGFRLNLDCFYHPVNALMLKQDFEDMHQERRFSALPAVRKANDVQNSFYTEIKATCPEKMELLSGIGDFSAYLETVAFKLAHYFGFIFADDFLPSVVPGYTPDTLTSKLYSWQLQDCLRLNPELCKA